ncbi:hypothetical protein TcasGA2_TC011511 [Tribolium castaneum]|uniref:Uncharacterized protein n=1 Tax=Tribolium castaneum TaxID=7070 RepID=D6W6F3_TRICA|nr:hypothetical protein TcasGA2_TC011511 [Tribolium castaneum]
MFVHNHKTVYACWPLSAPGKAVELQYECEIPSPKSFSENYGFFHEERTPSLQIQMDRYRYCRYLHLHKIKQGTTHYTNKWFVCVTSRCKHTF